MNGVGFCAVSRSIQVAQHLYDIYVHKQEKLGSRPISTILVGAGFKGGQIMRAVQVAAIAMDNEGLERYSRAVGIGSEDPNASITPLTLNEFDPFDEQTSVTLAIYGLAAAFGIPIQEVWPAAGGRSGREGGMQESRQRGKLPAEYNAELGLQIEQKYLPPYLKAIFDYRDDFQDERQGVNRDIRARNRERDLGNQAVSVRVAREQMVEIGDATRTQFQSMELEDGRLEDGRPVGVLFYSSDDTMRDSLDLGVANPTDVLFHDKLEMQELISTQRALVHESLASVLAARKRTRLQQALAALDWLYQEYELYGKVEEPPEGFGFEQEGEDAEESGPDENGEPVEKPQEGEQEAQTRDPDQVRPATLSTPGKVAGPW
jgi:hypothetical protein